MYKIINGFIGHEQNFAVETYENIKILHQRNSLGHRSIEADEALSNPRGYLLVSGCSITEGVALNFDETWPNLLAKKLKLPVYNLALQGTGLDCQLHNLQRWLWEYPRPKFLVRTDTEKSQRFMKFKGLTGLVPEGTWSNKDILTTILSMEDHGLFDVQYKLWQEVFPTTMETVSITVKPVWIDKAPDGYHPGPRSHHTIAELAFTSLMKTLKRKSKKFGKS